MPSSFQAKSQFKRRSTANNVEIIIPVPPDADSPKFKTTVGSCKYAPDQSSVIWTIKSFPVSLLWRILLNLLSFELVHFHKAAALLRTIPSIQVS